MCIQGSFLEVAYFSGNRPHNGGMGRADIFLFNDNGKSVLSRILEQYLLNVIEWETYILFNSLQTKESQQWIDNAP